MPKPFDVYYFVELDSKNKEELEKTIKENFPKRKSHVVTDDCNNRLIKQFTLADEFFIFSYKIFICHELHERFHSWGFK